MASRSKKKLDIAAEAKRLLGFRSLRPGQKDAIQALLDGQDTLVVQPTGSGKSAIYQIAGALLQQSVVIISPLIALQKDQADFIEGSKLESVAVVNSTQPVSERRDLLDRIEQGSVEYILLAPEQLRKQETIERLQAAGVALFVVDEAHCVSQWGHDFRPDYLQLSVAIEELGHPPVLAMTATASQEVRAEIVERLGMRSPRVLVHGFDRPNISLRVDIFSSAEEKREAILRRVEFAETPGIIYVATHKNAESIARDLHELGIEAVSYHGGLKAKDREAIQDRFMSGAVPVIVATNAFGMGVDKADIRFVYHADISESLDSYYQEIGRAGRDGKCAEAVLFYRSQDISSQKYKAGGGRTLDAELEQVANALAGRKAPIDIEKLTEQTHLSARKLLNALHRLEEVGAVKQLPSGEIKLATTQSPAQIVEAAAKQQELRKELKNRRLEQMQRYAEIRSCRREYLLHYFGDDYSGPCRNCDRCQANVVTGSTA